MNTVDEVVQDQFARDLMQNPLLAEVLDTLEQSCYATIRQNVYKDNSNIDKAGTMLICISALRNMIKSKVKLQESKAEDEKELSVLDILNKEIV